MGYWVSLVFIIIFYAIVSIVLTVGGYAMCDMACSMTCFALSGVINFILWKNFGEPYLKTR
jgi:hypothetical protein